jgi:hypothetical protein
VALAGQNAAGIPRVVPLAAPDQLPLSLEATPSGWANCRRYQVKERTGKCPENILPNSLKTVEQIAQQYNLQLLS